MRASTAQIKQFMSENANVYPHSEVKLTRNGCYFKWIILQSRDRKADLLSAGEGYLHLLPTACIDSDTLQLSAVLRMTDRRTAPPERA